MQTHSRFDIIYFTFRLYWDLLMLIFLITNLVVLPVSIAFFYDDVGAHWIVFNITCDTMFILDIIINFRTGKPNIITVKIYGAWRIQPTHLHSDIVVELWKITFSCCTEQNTKYRVEIMIRTQKTCNINLISISYYPSWANMEERRSAVVTWLWYLWNT